MHRRTFIKSSLYAGLSLLFPSGPSIRIDGERQQLIWEDGISRATYVISTATNGFGTQVDSYQTPTGLHRIFKKIGDDVPLGGIFRNRRFTGETADIHRDDTDTSLDLITSRILWLEGLEAENRTSGGRGIYIHGTNEEGLLGTPSSRGCIRMANRDVIELYERTPVGTQVYISDKAL